MRSARSLLGVAVTAGLTFATVTPLTATAAPTTPQTPPQPGHVRVLPTTPLPATPDFEGAATTTRYVSVGVANVRSAPSMDARVVGSLPRGQKVTGPTVSGWIKLGEGRYIGLSVTSPNPPSQDPPSTPEVTRYVDVPVANVRSGPGLNHGVVGTLRSGTKVQGTSSGGWVRMDGGRFISETVLRSQSGPPAPAPPPSQPTQGYVNVASANVRSGPGLSHPVVGSLPRATEVRGQLQSGWVRMADGRFISTTVLSTTPPGGGDPRPGDVTRQQVLTEAAKYAGIMYKWGGTDPSGFDCSGYVQYVYRQLGITLPRSASQQRAHVTSISSPKPGDLVFWGNTHHVAIYAGDGYIWDSGRPGLPVQKRKVFSGVTGYGAVEGVVN